MRSNAANKNFVIEAREREQAVRIRKTRKETEFRAAQQITDEKREYRNQRIKDQKQEQTFVASSFLTFMEQKLNKRVPSQDPEASAKDLKTEPECESQPVKKISVN